MTKFRRRTALSVPVAERVDEGCTPATAADIQSLARSKTETAICVLAKIMLRETANAFARVAAARTLLEYGWGRPVQRIESGDGSATEPITEIRRIIVYPKRRPEDDEEVAEAPAQDALPDIPASDQKRS